MKRTGLTIIELLVSLSLSAILLTALSGVLRTFARQVKKNNDNHIDSVLHTFDRILWNDLAQARGVALDEGVLSIVKPHPNPSQRIGTLLVAYRLIPSQNRTMRLQRSIYNGNHRSKRLLLEQTLFWDVSSVSFSRIDDFGVEQPLPTQIGPAPHNFLYTLRFRNSSEEKSCRIVIR